MPHSIGEASLGLTQHIHYPPIEEMILASLVVGSGVAIGVVGAVNSVVGTRSNVRSSVVATSDGLVAVVGIGRSDSGASVGSVVAGAVVVGSSRGGKATTSSSRNGANLGVTVTGSPSSLFTLPELHAGTGGVAVAGTGTKGLLLLVVAHEEDLDEGAKKEEDGADDGDSHAGGVELADGAEGSSVGDLVALAVGTKALLGTGRAVAEGSLDVALAAGSTVTCHDCNGDHGTAAEKVEEDAEEGKDFFSAEAACQQDSENGVQDNGTGQTRDGLLPGRNACIAISLYSEKVAVDAQYNGRAAKLECIQGSRAKLECSTAETHVCNKHQLRAKEDDELVCR